MKRILSWLTAVSIMLTSCSLTAFASISESDLIYNQRFESADAISELSIEGEASATVTATYSDGAAVISKNGNSARVMLPESVSASDFVAEYDAAYNTIGSNSNIGFVFNYADEQNYSILRYYANNGNVRLESMVNGSGSVRREESGRGAGFTKSEGENIHFKLVVNSGKMDFYADETLLYTFNGAENAGFADFSVGGRIGLFIQDTKTTIDNIVVRNVLANDINYYSNTFIDPNQGLGLENKTGYNSMTNNKWGHATYSKNGNTCFWYYPQSITGNWIAEVEFTPFSPSNVSRWFGLSYGVTDTSNYSRVAFRVSGDKMFYGQVTDGTAKDSNVSKDTFVAAIGDKWDSTNACANYATADAPYNSETNPGGYSLNNRYKLTAIAMDGTVDIYLDGTKVASHAPTSTDGYIGLVSNGCGALIYSMRIAPYDPTADTILSSSYTADFTNSTEIDKWTNIFGTNKPTVQNGVLSWTSGGATQYLLPTSKLTDFVLEADIEHNANNNKIGFIYNCDGNTANQYNTLWFKDSNAEVYLAKTTITDGKISESAVIESKDGYQYNTANGYEATGNTAKRFTDMSGRVKLVCYNGKVAFWVNNQLLFTYNTPDYNGGYVGLTTNYYGVKFKSLSVRKASADDMIMAESFQTIGKLKKIYEYGNNITPDRGKGLWAKYGGTIAYYAEESNSADQVYNVGFAFNQEMENVTRYVTPIFGIKKTDSGYSMWGTTIKADGTVELVKITANDENANFSFSVKERVSADKVKAIFPDKLGTYTVKSGSADGLMPNKMFEYRHVLNDGNIDIYLDGVKLISYADNELKSLEGMNGILRNGAGVTLYYMGVNPVTSYDLEKPNMGRVCYTDIKGLSIPAENVIVRFYENDVLHTTAVTDANGMFDATLRNRATYTAKLYANSSAAEPILEQNVTYTGEQITLNAAIESDFATLLNVKFTDDIKDSSMYANSVKLIEGTQAQIGAFDGSSDGKALVLDGVGDGAYVENTTGLELKNDKQKLTVEAVFKPEERDGIKTMAVLGGITSAGYGIYVDKLAGNDVCVFKANIGGTVQQIEASIALDTLYYAAATFDGTQMKLYLNGEEVASKEVSGSIEKVNNLKTGIGVEWDKLNDHRRYFFKGIIDSVKVSNCVLTAEEISTNNEELFGNGTGVGDEFTRDIVASVAFDNTEPTRGDSVTVNVKVINKTKTDKTVNVKLVPGYFALLTDASDTIEVLVAGKGETTVSFNCKMLAGGRETFNAYVTENGAVVAEAKAPLSVIGSGYYKGDIHDHSTRSDGTNTIAENVAEAFASKNLSYNYSTEHNTYNYWYWNYIYNNVNTKYNPLQYRTAAGSEITTDFGHTNVYRLQNIDISTEDKKDNKPFWDENKAEVTSRITEGGSAATAAGWQSVIDEVTGTMGGLFYINHSKDSKYSMSDDIVKELRGFTGYEVWSGYKPPYAEQTIAQRDTWDKINSLGWGHVAGHSSTDAHGAVMMGNIQQIAYMDELTEAEINRVMADGNSIMSNGPEVRFNINGAPMNGTANILLDGDEVTFNVNVFDPMGDITKVTLVKNSITNTFTADERTEEILFQKGSEKVAEWSDSFKREVNEGEFYRIEVETAKSRYEAITSVGIAQSDESANVGYAITNNIWIEAAEKSNSTNINAISYDGTNAQIRELNTGIKYIAYNGAFDIDKLNVSSDGEARKLLSDEKVVITVSAEDGTLKTTEIYLVKDETIPEGETAISSSSTEIAEGYVGTIITVDDAEGVLTDASQIILAIYDGNKLIGLDIQDVNPENTATEFAIEGFAPPSNLENMKVKAILVDSLTGLKALCKSIIVE